MTCTPDVVEEINVLARYNLESTQQGLKIHSSAEPEVIAAANRLFAKGLTTQTDGGYLTNLGITAAEHTQKLLRILG